MAVSRLLTAAVCASSLLLASAGSSAADDGWNPFKERDAARQAARAAHERNRDSLPPAGASTLPPMSGVTSKPWNDNPPPPGSTPGDQPRWNDQPAPWSASPPGSAQQTFGAPAAGAVQRSELQPIEAAPLPPPASAPGMPQASASFASSAAPSAPVDPAFWQGTDMAGLAELISPLSLPPRSGALSHLWRRLLSSTGAPPPGPNAEKSTSFDAIRMEALYRSGFVSDLRSLVAARQAEPAGPVEALLVARTRLMVGDREPGCSTIKGLQRSQSSLPKPARREFLLLAALCGVGDKDQAKAGLAAELLRAEGASDPIALATLDALASGGRQAFKMPGAKTLSLLDYRFLELVDADPVVADAEPALLSVVAISGKSAPARILAAEAALALHAVTPEDLATAYRVPSFAPTALAHPLTEPLAPPMRRALLFKALEAEGTPIKKARLARALLDEVRRTDGPYQQVAAMLAPALAGLRPAADLPWFAETAIEIALAGREAAMLATWTSPQSGMPLASLEHWLVLADIAQKNAPGHRGAHLAAAERLAVSGKLAPELMHRLVTVLDALDYQIPIPLWEAASRAPQPTSGFLPETGILSRLQDASKHRQQARVILLAMRALGPESAATAHMIALGDTIRALKRAGLETDARRLGMEALFMAWPRTAPG